jgi:hypothetical protein
MAVLYRKKQERIPPDPTPVPAVDPTDLKKLWLLCRIAHGDKRDDFPLMHRWTLIRSLIDYGLLKCDVWDIGDEAFEAAATIPCTKGEIDGLGIYARENPNILEQLMELLKEN